MSAAVNCAQADLLEPKKNVEIRNESQKIKNSDYFNLANIFDSFFSNNDKIEENTDNSTQLRQEFILITSKFNQGNAISAYSEYEQLIDKLDDDILLLNISKVLCKIGFFSLAKKAEEKIVYKNQYYNNLNDLEISYRPKANLTVDDEIFFAKLYSSIFFDNSALEAQQELLGKKETYQKNDYYYYLLAQSYFEQKDYHKALNTINKAISINSDNINYKLVKTDILSSLKKYSEALSIVKKLEKNRKIIDLASSILIKEQTIIAQSTKNDRERKYSTVYKTFLEGNYEKVKKECLSILNFDKNNDKIISLYARSELALGNVERANTYFINAYKIDKNNIDTLIGIGDIRFIHKDYKNSVKMYKRALKQNSNSAEVLIKLASVQKAYGNDSKTISRINAKLNKVSANHIDYYNCAISSAQKNTVLKENFLRQSLAIDPLYKLSLGEAVEHSLKNKNYKTAKSLVDFASFTLEKNYYYYYLLGLYNQAENKKQEAIQFYKTSLDLNPNFEIANIKLLKLIPNRREEI